MAKKFFVLSGVLLIAVFGLVFPFAFQKDKGLWEKIETIRIIQAGDPLLYLPQYIALWKGYFEDEKIKVEFVPVASENFFLSALKAGRGDVLAAGLEQAIYAHTDHGEKVVAFCALTKKDHTVLVARDPKPFQWSDLKGKTVITGPPGSRQTVVFKGVLAGRGLTPNRQVTLYTNIPLTLQAGAFKSGTGDYILLPEPEASIFEQNGLGKASASLGEEIGELPAVAYLAHENRLKERAEAIQRFTNAIYKAQLWLKDNDAAEIFSLAGQHFAQENKIAVQKGIEKFKTLGIWAESPIVPLEKYERFVSLFVAAREIPQPVPYDLAVESTFAEKAVQSITYQPSSSRSPATALFSLLPSAPKT